MAPPEPLNPPEGQIVPYGNDILTLAGGRWLTMTGSILNEPVGDPVSLQDNTRRYWDGRAVVAGSTLDDLLREEV